MADLDAGETEAHPARRLDLLALASLVALGRDGDLAQVPWAVSGGQDLASSVETRFARQFEDPEGRAILRALRLP